jgi:sugar phosphate isomerase/epimerase
MSDWPVGLSTGCFYRTSIFDCIEPIRNSGFRLIEVCSFPAHLDYHDAEALKAARRRIDELGMEPYSLHAPFADGIYITSLDEGHRHEAREELIQAADAAGQLGVRYLVNHPGPEKGGFPEHERCHRMEHAAGVLTEVSHACRERNVALVLENMLPHLFSGRCGNCSRSSVPRRRPKWGSAWTPATPTSPATCGPWPTSRPVTSG